MNAILFRDLLLNMLLGLTALVVLVLPTINPPAKAALETKPAGTIAVSIAWPDGDDDVDLWLSGPGQEKATGYSNKAGKLFSLLRDDMGYAGDAGPINMENAFARYTPAGDYVVNIHGYAIHGPTMVHVEIALNGTLLVSTEIELRPTQERTVIRFTLDGASHVVATNRVFKPLRSAGK